MGAAYLFHLIQNHAFNDGNKRIAVLAASVLLETNGWKIVAEEEQFENLVMEAAQGQKSKEQIAEFFKENTQAF